MRITAAVTRARRRVERAPSWTIDAVLGTVIVLVGLTTAVRNGTDPGGVYRDRDALAVSLILASTLPYYVRRRAPAAVFVVTATAVAVLMLRHYEAGALPWVLFVGAYTVAAYRPAREVLAVAAIGRAGGHTSFSFEDRLLTCPHRAPL